MDSLNALYSFQNLQHQMQMQTQNVRKHSVGPDVSLAKPPAGSLIIADFFTPSRPDEQFSHGEVVNMAARQNGFQGPVVTMDQPNSIGAQQAISRAETVITNPNASREDILRAISERTAASAVSLVETQTQAVRQATASGAENSVLNLSMGSSKAGLTAELYSHARGAWEEGASPDAQAYGRTVADNYAKAYDLDPAKLYSSDADISGPERTRLQQHLVNHVNHTLENNSRLDGAQEAWSNEVRRFESGNNSVVISAGNHADDSQAMLDDAGGRRMLVPPDYEKNILEIPEVTTVGATRWHDTGEGGVRETTADYSSRSAGVNVYASGSVDYDGDQKADNWGTSFSAPRVGAAMAEIHRQNPGMTSAQVENLMRNQLTRPLNGSSGEIQVLDYQTSSDFLVGRRGLEE